MTTYAQAKEAITSLKNLGFCGAVITPHIYEGVFDNDATNLRASFETLVAGLHNDGVEFPLYLAAEYFADAHFLKLINRRDLLDIAIDGERWVLMEFSYVQETPFADACLSALVARGYRPVIAHVERYRFVANAPERWLKHFARYGAILQGDIGSLAGQHGVPVQSFAVWLLDKGHVPIWGTDIHNPGQIERHIMPGLKRLSATKRLNNILDPILEKMAA